MHGNPLFRVLVLTVVLAVTGLLVAAVARAPKTGAAPDSRAAPSALETGSLPVLLSLQLSAPARSVSITSPDRVTRYLAPHQPSDLTAEFRALVPVLDNSITLLLNIEWVAPSENRFIRIVVEPDYLENRELVLHAPDHLRNHAITFQWVNPEVSGQGAEP